MMEKRQYNGLDVTKFILAVLVAARHMIQMFYPAESKWRLLICSWLGNLAVPGFFVMAGFFLFRKTGGGKTDGDKAVVFRYCGKVFKLALIWSAIYFPINIYWWYTSHPRAGIAEWILDYIKGFFLCHPIVQLWFLPALFTACLLVWFLYSKGMKIWQLLTLGGILFGTGCFVSNRYFGPELPGELLLQIYFWYFVTMRNGIFYGVFFVAMGLWFAKTEERIPLKTALAGFVLCLFLMFLEVLRYHNTDWVLFGAPTAFFMIAAALAFTGKNHDVYARLRGMSQWIYLSQYYFLFGFSLIELPDKIPFTKKTVTVAVMVPVMLFSAVMVRLSETERFNWLKKLI